MKKEEKSKTKFEGFLEELSFVNGPSPPALRPGRPEAPGRSQDQDVPARSPLGDVLGKSRHFSPGRPQDGPQDMMSRGRPQDDPEDVLDDFFLP